MSLMLGTVYGAVMGSDRGTYVAGACFSGLVLVKAASFVYLPIFLIYVFVRSGFRVRAICRFTVPVVVAITVLAGLNFVRFGNFLEFGYGAEGGMFSLTGVPANLVRASHFALLRAVRLLACVGAGCGAVPKLCEGSSSRGGLLRFPARKRIFFSSPLGTTSPVDIPGARGCSSLRSASGLFQSRQSWIICARALAPLRASWSSHLWSSYSEECLRPCARPRRRSVR